MGTDRAESIEERIVRESAALEEAWNTDPRWKGVRRTYRGEDVIRLRGSFRVEHSVARVGAERLWRTCQRR